MAELTPMMQQYLQIKEQNQDAILFFRLGDFYEMFGADARTASRELDLTLTSRDKDKNKTAEERVPMCGVPYHAADAYIARGYVFIGTDVTVKFGHKALAKTHNFRVRFAFRVKIAAALAAAHGQGCKAVFKGLLEA